MKKFLLIVFMPFCLPAQVSEIVLHTNWKFHAYRDSAWYNATVPGTVHTDLLANKKIVDPFSPGAEKKLKWIEETDWEYQTFFSCDSKILAKENIELIFEGLDTYALVYLNDSLIVRGNNMFRSWTVSVKKLLRSNNKLRIGFIPAAAMGKELAKLVPYTLPEGERVFTRKAQYEYGWDLAPRFVTCGIWKPVKLLAWNSGRLSDIRTVPYNISDSSATINFAFDIHCGKKGDYSVVVIPLDEDGKGMQSVLNSPVNAGISTYEVDHMVKNPRLWWCNGMGEASLYYFKVELRENGKMIDSKEVTTGIRKIKLDTSSSSKGSNFSFTLNNVPVFMKGANFVPPDVFLPRVKKEDYTKIVEAAVDANMNMLRVWGGGTYADDEFYKLCDQKGILVWQDLMFACAMYPGDKDFIDNSLKEVEEQVNRLIGHPCVALWCGNNESDEGWKNWGWQKQFNYTREDSAKIWNSYVNFFEKLVPAKILDATQGFEVNYISSSPKYGWGRRESMLSGDSHYWGVWWGMEPLEVYNKKIPHFMSEYGFQALPAEETLQQQCGEVPDSTCLKTYEKHARGFATISQYMQRDYKMPKTFPDYVYVSQLVQARGLQIAIEAHRRNKPYCMGSLYWQLNDCWPGITWSSIDFYGSWKAAHYTAKNCYGDVIVSAIEENDSLKVYVISDRIKALEGKLNYEFMDLHGKPISKNSKQIAVEANSSRVVLSVPLSKVNKNDLLFFCSLDGIGTRSSRTIHYFVSPKDLPLPKPRISIRWLGDDQIEVSSDVLAKKVFLSCQTPIHFEDNFFDLLPGETKVITVKGASGKHQTINVKSLVDTY